MWLRGIGQEIDGLLEFNMLLPRVIEKTRHLVVVVGGYITRRLLHGEFAAATVASIEAKFPGTTNVCARRQRYVRLSNQKKKEHQGPRGYT